MTVVSNVSGIRNGGQAREKWRKIIWEVHVSTYVPSGAYKDQYKAFLKHFGESTKLENEETMLMANMTYRFGNEDDLVVDSDANGTYDL